MSCCPSHKPSHFKGKEAVEHVIEAQAQGILSAAEEHGTEMPGHLFAAADSARETALIFLLISTALSPVFIHPSTTPWILLAAFTLGWTLWKIGRGAWLGWVRLERLHRLMAEEKWEIVHHRKQERQELAALYEAKGFKGKLLEDVLDVLMSDEDRLLRVMLEEELGLRLEKLDHPLKQGVGAGFGALFTSIITFITLAFFPTWGPLTVALLISGCAGGLSAYYERNRVISAVVWNVSLVVLAYGSAYFFLRVF